MLFGWIFILNGCGGGSGGGLASSMNTAGGISPVITAFSINGYAGVVTNNQIAITLPFGTNTTALIAKFTAPGSVVSVGGVTQISGVTSNNFSQPVIYTISRIATNTSSAKAISNNTAVYTVTVTVASISAKSITAFSLSPPSSTAITSGIISITNISVTMPFGTNITNLVATFTPSGQNVTVNGVNQVSGATQNDFTNPVTYTVTAADGTIQNYIVTVAVASSSANDITSFSLNGTAGVISSGGLSQTIVVKVPNATNVNGLVASFITTGVNVAINGVTQISGTMQNDFTNPVTYIVAAANGVVQTYTVTVIVSSASSNFINAYSFGNIAGVISGQNIAVTVPFGTDVTGVVASFTTTGVNVTVGGLNQTSSLTTNNFTNPVIYTVIAADGTTATYTVTVTVSTSSAKSITAFAFGTTTGVITGKNIAVTMPFGTDVTDLIATFTTTGVRVSVNGVTQVSGTTLNNFTNPVSYVVTAADGSTSTYTVTVTISTVSAKTITAYSLAGTSGIINGFSITVSLPFGTDVTALVATFSTTGKSVAVNGVTQFSGTTTNNFTNPVTYIVTAADNSTASYTVTVNFTNNLWTWVSGTNALNPNGVYGTQGTGSVNNIPGGRLSSAIQLISGNVWLFGGTGLGASGSTSGNLNDLWQYNPSNNQWTWMGGSNTINQNGTYGTQGTGSVSNIPGGRNSNRSWTDGSGNLWIFGGSGYGASGGSGSLNDLWEYSTSTGQWTWISGSSATNQNGTYGTKGVGSVSNTPGARDSAFSWVDASGNLWLFGGRGFAASGGSGNLNDLWKYTPSNNQWTWISGANSTNQVSTYGTLGVAAPTNVPGARYSGGATWVDSSGNLWLFGGFGFNASTSGYLNDLWQYSPSSGQWTWVGGSSSVNQNGIYGTQGIGSTGNIPGSRIGEMSWMDSAGNLWLFGGFGFPASGIDDFLNDLWEYTPSTSKWTWLSGSNAVDQIGNYGTKGVGATTNIPGARSIGITAGWTDGTGNLWLFGGVGYGTSSTTQDLNDLWQYHY